MNWDAEEGAHRGVIRRKPDRARILAEVVKAKGRILANEDTENPSALRVLADRGMGLRIDAGGGEALKRRAAAGDHAQRGIERARELRGRSDYAPEQREQPLLR